MAAFTDVLRSAEVTESLGPPRRARLRIDARPFHWAEHPEDVESHGDALMSARYSLRLLEIRDARIAHRAATFRGAHGYRDFGWSVYARSERLGDVHRADAYARAAVLVVLLHGAFTSRAIWHDMAVGIARDNPTAMVLVPDLIGFGASALTDDAPRVACTPQGMMRAVRDWIGTLGLEGVPCVLVGHSFSATALMCARRADLGPLLHRLCLSPILPFANRRERLKAHALGMFSRMTATLPRAVQRAVAQRMFARDPALNRVLPAARSAMANAAMTLGARRLGHLMTEIARLRPAPAAELDDCTVVTVPDDPLVPDHLVADTVAAAGIGSDHCYRLAYGGHFPQLADTERPEWIARNVHEFVNLIDALLERARNTAGSSDQRSPEDVPTVFEP